MAFTGNIWIMVLYRLFPLKLLLASIGYFEIRKYAFLMFEKLSQVF